MSEERLKALSCQSLFRIHASREVPSHDLIPLADRARRSCPAGPLGVRAARRRDGRGPAGEPVPGLELGETPVRPVTWEVAPPRGVRHGLVPVGPHTDSALAVAWDPEASSLWLDADGDRRFARDERHEVKPGATVAIPVTIAGADPARRTILVRPGLLGGGPRYTVRGGMAGELELGGKAVRAAPDRWERRRLLRRRGTDRVWVDLDGDGRFDPVAEQFPLGTPIPVGKTSYTVASDPWARSVSAHERDTRLGRLRLSLGGRAPDREARRALGEPRQQDGRARHGAGPRTPRPSRRWGGTASPG